MGKQKAINVGGTVYDSIEEAAQALGVSTRTINNMLRDGRAVELWPADIPAPFPVSESVPEIPEMPESKPVVVEIPVKLPEIERKPQPEARPLVYPSAPSVSGWHFAEPPRAARPVPPEAPEIPPAKPEKAPKAERAAIKVKAKRPKRERGSWAPETLWPMLPWQRIAAIIIALIIIALVFWS
jgi:hypothetical protein